MISLYQKISTMLARLILWAYRKVRAEKSKTEKRKRSLLDWLLLLLVLFIALVITALSLHSTMKLAGVLGFSPGLFAFLVEILFSALLFIRARQRATQRNLPDFVNYGFFGSFLIVTAVNVYGLYESSGILGAIVGCAISGALWLMESVMVWFWTEGHLPYQKSPKELKREAEREIKEMKIRQEIEWMKWEAQKPDLDLIKKARKAEKERKKVISQGLPEYFRIKFGIQPQELDAKRVAEKQDTAELEHKAQVTEKMDYRKQEEISLGLRTWRMWKSWISKLGLQNQDAKNSDAEDLDAKERNDKKLDVERETQKLDVTTGDTEKLDDKKQNKEKQDAENLDTAKKRDTKKAGHEKRDAEKQDVKKDNVVKFPSQPNLDVITLDEALELAKSLNMSPETLEEVERVLQYAFEVKEEKKKFPGRQKLKQDTNCSEYVAKEAARILNTLKKKYAS